MENHVPNIELCKKLKELGYGLETEYSYCPRYWNDRVRRMWASKRDTKDLKEPDKHVYPAPLATELLEELPEESKEGLKYKSDIKKWDQPTRYESIVADESLPNALAKMWIYLKENNLL